MESLEDRRMLAGPQLISLQPNGDALLKDGDVRNTAPTDLTFRFDRTQVIDPATVGGIRLVRAGSDGIFGNGNDVTIQPGFAGIGEKPNEVILRFASSLPDDKYRIDLIGAGATSLRNVAGEPFNAGVNQSLFFELDLGAQVLAVVPQPTSRNPAGRLTQARNQVDIYFNNDDLFVENDAGGNPTTRSVEHPSYYQLIFTNDTVTNQDDFSFPPTRVQYDPVQDKVTLTFAADLDQLINPNTGQPVRSGTFRLRVGTNEAPPFAPNQITPGVSAASDFNTGGAVTIRFQATGVAAESFGTTPTIVVSKADQGGAGLPLVSVSGNVVLLQLNTHAGNESTAQDVVAAINGHAVAGKLLTASLSGNPATNVAAPAVNYSPIKMVGLGSSFATSTNLGQLGAVSQIISSAIDPQPYLLDFPGGNDEPGHREIPEEVGDHFDGHINPDFGADKTHGSSTILYNFKPAYGPNGRFVNVITENQKQRAREAVELWGNYLGVQFLETSNQGITIATGDPKALDITSPNVMNHAIGKIDVNMGFIVQVDPKFADSLLILDNARQWSDLFGGDWFRSAMIGIGAMLGLERATDLPSSTLMAFASNFVYPGQPAQNEPVFPGNQDIAHGRHLYRADSNDIDFYRFEVNLAPNQRGVFTAETFAERQANSSLLDTVLSLYRERPDGTRELIARNDDYFSEDSYIEVPLGVGVYYIGVSAAGNDNFNPEYENAGFGGTSQGNYDLRLSFRPELTELTTIREATAGQPGTPIDGDGDGKPGGAHNFWFRVQELSKTIFVDKITTGPRLGTLANPYDKISTAFTNARPGDLVRIVGNGGFDGNRATLKDNFAYEIGFGTLPGQTLTDGTTMAIPRGVTVMVDSGAIFKLQRARIGVGSSSLGVDRSQGALQVLGTPFESVYFTSFLDEEIGLDTHLPTTVPKPGDWGGLVFRNDLDNREERFNYAEEGIFLNNVSHGDIRYGGGNVVIDSIQQIVTPIQMIEARPTIAFNLITRSADAAMSADPDSFEETNFHAPRFQLPGIFTSDYSRIGPDIRGNRLQNNSTNGLFVRIQTPAGNQLRPLTVSGRFNDTDVVHVIAENLRIQGTPGESILELARPPVDLVTLNPLGGGQLPAGSYNYKLVFIDTNGFEGRPSEATATVTVGAGSSLRLNTLPPATGSFVARRLYRSGPGGLGPYRFVAKLDASDTTFVDNGSVTGSQLESDPPSVLATTVVASPGGSLAPGVYNYRVVFVDAQGRPSPSSDPTASVTVGGANGSVSLANLAVPTGAFVTKRIYRSGANGQVPYTLIAEIPAGNVAYLDDGTTLSGILDPSSFGVVRARLDARLAIDPGTVVKLEGARIETTFGAQFIAEGQDGREVIFTSKLDDRYGAGGTFDTNNDGSQDTPRRGDWGGLYIGQLGEASIDHALITYGGGITKVEGSFVGFNVVEVHQANARITNSVIERNADGTGGQGPLDRFGRLTHDPATVFLRGSQPIFVNNIIRDNVAHPLTIDANSFTPDFIADPGRQTGFLQLTGLFGDNQGPLIRGNMMDANPLNGLLIRGGVLTTQSVWDDTDIVHVLFGQIIIPDFHTFGGLRLESSPDASLIVKMGTPGDSFDPTLGAGITAMGRQLDITDRIGGTLQIVGQSDFPVVITSLADDSVGAGFTPDNRPLTDTNADGTATLPRPGDWRSIRLEQYSNDRNVEVWLESESPGSTAPGENSDPDTAQFLGELSPTEVAGDDNLRLGFEVHGVLNARHDVDVYSFNATAGTEVWLDIDRTTTILDTVVELIDANGRVVARSDNSLAETLDRSLLFADPARISPSNVNPLQRLNDLYQDHHASGIAKDHFSTNVLDAGMRVILPGVVGTRSPYHVRVRSSSGDLSNLAGGLTAGSYQLQIRLQEADEVPGSTVRFAEIRYSTNGVELIGVPYHSPLVGEAAEDESKVGPESNNSAIPNPFIPGAGPQQLGNLLATDRGTLSIGGRINNLDDVDFFNFQVIYDAATNRSFQSTPIVADIDYADGLSRPNTTISLFDKFGRLVAMARDSNIADDQAGPRDNGSLADLSRGSLGTLDAYLGSLEVPEGDYYIAVSSNARIPQDLILNPNIRLEPNNSIIRIAEDHIGPSIPANATSALMNVLLDRSSVVPLTPDQTHMFVVSKGGNNLTTLSAVTPLTGQLKATINALAPDRRDLAVREDGSVYMLSAPDAQSSDTTAGNFLEVNTRTGAIIALNPVLDDNIITYRDGFPTQPGIPVVANVGVDFNGMTFGWMNGQERLFAVGDRGDAFPLNNAPRPRGPQHFSNLLYQLNPKTGLATSAPQANRTGSQLLQGAATQIVERGYLDTTVPGIYAEVEPNDGIEDFIDPDAMNLDNLLWTIKFNPDIGNQTQNTSLTVPHITINGTGDGTFDYYSFTPVAGSHGVFDIDNANFDTQLFLYDSLGNLLFSNDDSSTSLGALGSTSTTDSYLEYTFPTSARYSIAVARFPSTGDPNGVTGTPPAAGDRYTLHVSLENHFADTGDIITGIAMIDEALYAVSNGATLYRVNNPLSNNASLTTIREFGTDTIAEIEPNNTLVTAQSLENVIWTLKANPLVGDTTNNISRTTPHMTINGTGNGTFDYYWFDVALPNSLGIFDIDLTNDTFDSFIAVYNSKGVPIASNDNGLNINLGGFGSDRSDDSYLQVNFPEPGRYIVGVGATGATAAIGGLVGPTAQPGDVYTLNVAVVDHDYGFTGLSARPEFARNTHSNMLVMSDWLGTLYAVDTTGAPLPFFTGGVSQVETSVVRTRGVAYSRNPWHITDRRQREFGHGQLEVFDDSRGNASIVREIEPNNTILEAHNLEKEFWSTGYDPNIGDAAGNNISTTVPHVTVTATGDNTFDFYQFRVEIPPNDPNGAVIGYFDIDVPLNEHFDFSNQGIFYSDLELYLFDEQGNLLASNLGAPITAGAQGSIDIRDPFIQFNFTQNGNYAIAVARTIPPTGQPVQIGDAYTLNVAIEEHRNDGFRYDGGQSFYFGFERSDYDPNPLPPLRGDYDAFQGSVGSVLTYPFSLVGYSGADKPTLYYTYRMHMDNVSDTFRVFGVRPDGSEVQLRPTVQAMVNDQLWRQARIELDQFAGLDNVRIRFEVNTVDDVENLTEGVYLDDLIIGFAEHGELVSGANNNPVFAINPDLKPNEITTGEYQLEIRQGQDYGVSRRPAPNSLVLNRAFDTNDRQARQLTLVAPTGAQVTDGQTFRIGDGVDTLTFEYDSNGSVQKGNVRVDFQPTFTAPRMAASIRDSINGTAAQTVLDVTAALSDGTITGTASTDHKINLFGNAIVDPAEINMIVYAGIGDQNLRRDQGQVLIHSNFITDARDWGITVDAGTRGIQPRVPVGLLQAHPGAVRNLRELNNTPPGGLMPGAVIENNVIAGEGLGGIHFSGDIVPWELVPIRPLAFPLQNVANATSGDNYCDGDLIVIHSGRLTVTFEFEELGGSTRQQPCPGSGNQGGNGWTPGNQPIFYRKSGGGYLLRNLGYTQTEMAIAIRDAINSSILVTNGTTQTLAGYVANSRAIGDPRVGPDPALYVEHASSVIHAQSGLDCEDPRVTCKFQVVRRTAIQDGPQPFGRVLNNTIYGNDGVASFFAGTALNEPNDSVPIAVVTNQGRSHNPDVYHDEARIGDSVDFAEASLDVDLYAFQLNVRDRVTIDVSTLRNVPEQEPNDSLQAPQNLDGAFWSLAFNPNIGDALGNTSTRIPHVTVNGTGNGTFDYYSFRVSRAGARGIFDIDFGDLGFGLNDFELFLYDGAGNLLAENDNTTFATVGAGGSVSTFDPFLDYTFLAPGVYTIGVGVFDSVGTPGGITGVPPAAGQNYTLQVSVVDHPVRQAGLDSVLRLFNERGQQLAFSDNDPAPGELPSNDPYIDFTATEAGTYYVGISGRGNEVYDPLSLGDRRGPASTGDYDIDINVYAPRTWVLRPVDGTLVADGTTFQVSDNIRTVTYEFDDVNAPGVAPGNIAIPYDSTPVPNQGLRGPGYRVPEMAVSMSNVIGTGLTGVTALALGGPQGASGAFPNQVGAIIPDTIPFGVQGFGHNLPGTVPTTAGELHVVIRGASRVRGGVNFEPMLLENVDQLVPETGILVSEQASPTLLNNAMGNLESGIIHDFSPTTVVGATIFQHIYRTTSNVGASGADFNITLGPTEPFFSDRNTRNFYPAPRSRAIDSAIDSLEERAGMQTIKGAMGIPVSPILAPDRDANGLLRADDPDVSTPSGLGANVFKDRGALDRADFDGPDALLIDPRDNDAQGIDLDPATSVVMLAPGTYTNFSIQLVDGLGASESGEGVGINDKTISSNKVTMTEDGRLMREGVDYFFQYNSVANTIRLTPPTGVWPNDKTYVVTLNNIDRYVIDIPNGGQVADGQTFFILDENGSTVTFEFESGFSVLVPPTLTLQVPAIGVGPGGINDGQRFVVSDGAGNFFTFEYDSNVPPNVLPGNLRINIVGAVSANDVAVATVTALANASIGVTPVNLGGGRIHVGAATGSFSVDTTLTNLTQSGRTGVVADGQSFTIQNGANPVRTFEFDSNGVVPPGRVAIPFSAASTHNQIATAMANAVAGAGVGMNTAQHFGLGNIHLGGTVAHTVNMAFSPNLSLIGQPGVLPTTTLRVPPAGAGPGGIADGQTFTINDGTKTVRFEFDSDGRGQVGNRLILFTASSTVDQLANSIIAAILISNVGLTPVNLGNGQIRLFDTSKHSTNVSNSALTKSGVPGGSVPVNFLPDVSFDAGQFAPVILNTIRGSALSGYTILPRGGTTYFVEDVLSISGLPNFFVSAIQDDAGNALRPNQQTNVTQFIILMPGVQLDFGDAPATFPTQFNLDGARHVVPQNPSLFLGQGVSPDPNGQPGPNADADDDDGVVFGSVLNRFIRTPITVTASQAGLLDAWIDFNRDGDWLDPGEQIFANVPVSAGVNLLDTATPAFAQIGRTYARFRLSSAGALLTNGIATDGEVEDYAVDIVPGTPPVANNDAYATDEDTLLAIAAPGLLANDTDPDNDPLRILRADGLSAMGAVVVVDPLGGFTYDPTSAAAIQALSAGQVVVDTFTYQATDGLLPSNVATVSITLTGVNDRPVAVADAYATTEDAVLNVSAPGVMANDRDADASDTITVTAFSATSLYGATVTVNPNGSFSYDPRAAAALQALRPGQSLDDTFTYTISDTQNQTDTATVTITVSGLNDPPVAVNDAYATNEDTTLGVNAAAGLLANDSDAENDPITVSGFSAASNRGAVVNVAADGSFTYNPTAAPQLQALPAGSATNDTFTYTITDGRGGFANGTATINVTGVNDNPTGVVDNYAVNQDQVLNVAAAGVLANDSDVDTGDVISALAQTSTSTLGAAVTMNANGSFTYDPRNAAPLKALAPAAKTTDTFTYTVVDNNGGATVTTVNVVVTGVNNPPDAADDNYATNEDTLLQITAPGVLGNDSDPDGQPFTLINASTTSALGAPVVVNVNGSFTYDPRGVATLQALSVGQVLNDTFTYTIADTFNATDSATVTISVTGVNDAPVAANDTRMVRRNTTTAVDVLANDSDVDGTLVPNTVRVVGQPTQGTAVANGNGTVSYTPNNNYSGPDSFTYTVTDNDGAVSNVATVTINVNDPPVANNDTVSTFKNTPVDIAVLANDTDSDGTLQRGTVTVVQPPTNGTAVPNTNGTVTYTPNTGYEGQDTFTYTVADDDGAVSNVATVTIAILTNPFPWQNPRNPLDVNADGLVSPIDALLVINDLNFNGSRDLPVPPVPPFVPPPFLDTSGNNRVEAIDALLVINFLNSRGQGGGEGEGEGARSFDAAPGFPIGVDYHGGARFGAAPRAAQAALPEGEASDADYRLTLGDGESDDDAMWGTASFHRLDAAVEDLALSGEEHLENAADVALAEMLELKRKA